MGCSNSSVKEKEHLQNMDEVKQPETPKEREPAKQEEREEEKPEKKKPPKILK